MLHAKHEVAMCDMKKEVECILAGLEMASKETEAVQKQAKLTLQAEEKWENLAAKYQAVIAGMKTDSERAADVINGLRREMRVVQEKSDKAEEDITKASTAALEMQAEAHRTALEAQAAKFMVQYIGPFYVLFILD